MGTPEKHPSATRSITISGGTGGHHDDHISSLWGSFLSPFQRTLSPCVYLNSITSHWLPPALFSDSEILEMNFSEILGIPELLESNSKEEKLMPAVCLVVNPWVKFKWPAYFRENHIRMIFSQAVYKTPPFGLMSFSITLIK